MTTADHPDDNTLTWRKARRSNAGNNCVEVARTPAGYLIRDSKNHDGPSLPLDASSWAALIDHLENGGYRL